jgi:hypothetical protein
VVLFALASRYNGHNNGDLSLPFREARRLGISAQWKLYAGLRVLQSADLILCTRRGMLLAGKKLPSLYALAWRGIDGKDGVTYDAGSSASPIPRNDWLQWRQPDDWKALVKRIARCNRGESKLGKKNSDTKMLGIGHSQRHGAGGSKSASIRWGLDAAPIAPNMLESSKSSAR